uniref:Uncharacterized protein n=1 Tax=Desertifilum tharense IPPAS B-1220 TaxID=1781255 RepID=A0ACD5GQA6_9CYAN
MAIGAGMMYRSSDSRSRVRLEFISETRDNVRVEIVGNSTRQTLSFSGNQTRRSLDVPPGNYELRFIEGGAIGFGVRVL